jgi:hypothetical protein
MSLEEERFFYRTGRPRGAVLRPALDDMPMPALFARVADLTSLRYDFPVVLVEQPGGTRWIEPLSSLLDVLLSEVAPGGTAGERFRRAVLRLEREIRVLLAEDGADAAVAGAAADSVLAPSPPTLPNAWDRAAERLRITGGEPMAAELARARQALEARGLLVGQLADCDAQLPGRVVGHAWSMVEARKAQGLLDRVAQLRVTLLNLVRADLLRSGAGRGEAQLAAGIGAPDRGLFDFGVMARLLSAPSGETALPPARRARIDAALEVLAGQQFVGPGAWSFRFDRVDAALAAWREREQPMAELVRAIAVAELEATGRYSEARHDAYFEDFDPGSVGAEERALFPGYLVTIDAGEPGIAGRAMVLEALAGEAPLKVLLVTDDPLHLGGQLATTAMGLGNAYVLQAPSSHLFAVRDRVQAALEFDGPALVSVFNGRFPGATGLPSYLVASAALESRAFPAFAYDPSAGPGWPERFALLANPQPDRPWPVHDLRFADASLARHVETVAFTPLDFALCDPARASHFAASPPEHWAGLVPAGDWLDGAAGSGAAPGVPAVHPDGRLVRLAVDDSLVRDARRIAQAWDRLVQLDDLKRDMAVVAEPRAAGSEPAPSAVAAPPAQVGTPPGSSTPADQALAAAPAAPPATAEPERNPDEAYIETWRCTTCNECTAVNARMFAYNENRQAYIKDLTAGTYRDLVTAAESCQVAIIHPGKPRDPNEPGLADLIERAQPFL